MNDELKPDVALQEIDFLPASYHQKRQRQKKSVWRRAVLIVVVGIVVAGSLRQRQVVVNLERRRDSLVMQTELIASQIEDAAPLKQQIERLETRANLRANLQTRISSNRLLAAITNELPEFVSISSYRVLRETDRSISKRKRRKKDDSEEQSEEQPAAIDLRMLSENRQTSKWVVTVNGIAPDDVAISQYLDRLSRSDLFEQVTPLFTDEYRFRDHRLRHFGVRLTVRELKALETMETINPSDVARSETISTDARR